MKTQKHHQEFTHMEHHSSPRAAVKPVVTGLLFGSVVGAATALLFAPRSGQETRAEIRDKATEIRDQAKETVKDTVSQAKTKVHAVRENVWDKAAEIKQRGKRVANRELDQVVETAEMGKQRVNDY